MGRTRHEDPGALAACLHAAQRDADRFYGQGAAPAWQPSRSWRPWAGGVALLAALGGVAAGLWSEPSLPPAAPVTLAAAPAAALPAVIPSEVSEQRAAPGSPATPAPAPPSQVPAPAVQASIDPSLALPEDLTDWALDPQPTALPAPSDDGVRALHNTPPVPDESDTTPADETAPEDEPAAAPGE